MNELISCVENGLKKAEELQKQNASRNTLDLQREQALALKRLEPLIRVSNNRIIPKGENIFREGDFPQFLYFIDKGQVRLFVNSTDEKNLVFKIHEAHDFLGHVAILQNQAYEVTAQSLEECQIREIAIEDFLTYYQQYPEVALWFSHLLEFDLADRRQLLLMLLLSY